MFFKSKENNLDLSLPEAHNICKQHAVKFKYVDEKGYSLDEKVALLAP
jgi:hypothetical protein